MPIPPVRGHVVVEQPRHLVRQPRRHVDAVRDRADRSQVLRHARPDRRPHLAGDDAVEPADGVDPLGGAQGERRHVELRPRAVVVRAELHEPIAVLAQRAPAASEMRLDQAEREGIVPGRYRRVRREHRRQPHLFERLVEREARLDVIPDPLQDDEGRVPFVEVPDRRSRAEGLQRANAADAENDFLLDARLAVPAVQSCRQFAVPRRVFLEAGVQQIQLHPAEPYAPHLHQHAAVSERHGDDARLAVGRDSGFDRCVVPVQAFVRFLLPAFRRHALMEVPLRIHEADADQRDAQIAGFLAVIAGEHAEAAGVNRQRLVQRELRRKVGDRAGAVVETVLPPGVPRAAGTVQRLDRRVVNGEEAVVLCHLLQALRRDVAQHQHGVVRRLSPQRVVEEAEDLAR